ncbi:MAG: hypothetical protein E6Q50_17740 [Lysobacter sp.]|nr:MAG: hypothetical protein E6Q50_17740 [Lysobacter sp.]
MTAITKSGSDSDARPTRIPGGPRVVHSGHEIAIARGVFRVNPRKRGCFTAKRLIRLKMQALALFSPSFAFSPDFGAKRGRAAVHAQRYPQVVWIIPKSVCDPTLAPDSWNGKQVCVANVATGSE